MKKIVSLRISEELYAEGRKKAALERRSFGNWVEGLIADSLAGSGILSPAKKTSK